MKFVHALFVSRRGWSPRFSSRGVLRRLLQRRGAQTGLTLAAFLIASTLIWPFFLRYEPDRVNPANKLRAPSAAHLLGTDQYGRDQLARLLDGGRRSLGMALLVTGGVALIGSIVGLTAGMSGGIIDATAMRVVDVLLAVPTLVLALAVVGVIGVGLESLLLALIASEWARYARLVRSYVRLARGRQDVIVARITGVSWTRIAIGHIVPGVLAQLSVVATLDLGGIIIAVAGLSFLGLGVQPPAAEWGAMLAESRLFFTTAPWLLLAPATAIFLAVMSANLIGNALRDAADFGSNKA